MTNEAEAGGGIEAGDGEGRAWRPSGRPEHLLAPRDRGAAVGQIVQLTPRGSLLRTVRHVFGNPLVKIFIAISLFVVAALVFEATINGGSWTERPAPMKPAKQPRRAPQPTS